MHSGGSDQTKGIFRIFNLFQFKKLDFTFYKSFGIRMLSPIHQATYTIPIYNPSCPTNIYIVKCRSIPTSPGVFVYGVIIYEVLIWKVNPTIWAVFFYFWTACTITVEIYRRYIGAGCTRSALARQLIWKGILIYRRYIGACCTRSALARQLIF